MSRGGTKSRRTKADIDELVEKWRESGQSVPKFSAENSVASSSLYQWIAARRTETKETQRGSKAKTNQDFTEVEVIGRAEPRHSAALTIMTPTGHMVTVGAGDVDADALRMVLSVVGAC